jgi:hypothetical protein
MPGAGKTPSPSIRHLNQTNGLWDNGFSPRRSEESEGREESQLIAVSSLPSFSSFLRGEKASQSCVLRFSIQHPASSIQHPTSFQQELSNGIIRHSGSKKNSRLQNLDGHRRFRRRHDDRMV